jgi:phytol kinase
MSMILGIGLVYLVIMFGAEGLYRYTKIPPEWTRKLQHVLSGLLAACFPWIFSTPGEVVVLGAIMTAVLLVLRKSKFLSSMHGVKRKSFGEFYFLLSGVVLSILSWDRPEFYFISMLTLTISDTLAAIVGTAYKRVTYSIKGHVKSLEGSAAFFVSTLFTVYLPLQFVSDLAPLIAVNIALIVTLIEAVCKNGRDNILIPLSTFYLLSHCAGASVTLLVQELAGAVVLLSGLLYLLLKEKRKDAETRRRKDF